MRASRFSLTRPPTTCPIASILSNVDVLRHVLVKTLADLPDREREIVVATVLSDPPATLAVLGSRFGISRERVRQLRERGLERLRRALRDRALAPDCFM